MITLIYDLFTEVFKMGNWGVTKATRHPLAKGEIKARDSQWRIQGELRRRAIPESNKNHSPSTRQRRTKGEQLTNLLRADVSQTQWRSNHYSPWRVTLLVRRADAEKKLYIKPLDSFMDRILVFHSFTSVIVREREK